MHAPSLVKRNRMATSPGTIDYLVDQLAGAGEMRARKMFGEYALYLGGKVVALVCDDILFVKMTEVGKACAGTRAVGAPAYPGAKPWLRVEEDALDDREFLCELVRVTAEALPVPPPKKPRRAW